MQARQRSASPAHDPHRPQQQLSDADSDFQRAIKQHRNPRRSYSPVGQHSSSNDSGDSSGEDSGQEGSPQGVDVGTNEEEYIVSDDADEEEVRQCGPDYPLHKPVRLQIPCIHMRV